MASFDPTLRSVRTTSHHGFMSRKYGSGTDLIQLGKGSGSFSGAAVEPIKQGDSQSPESVGRLDSVDLVVDEDPKGIKDTKGVKQAEVVGGIGCNCALM